MSETSLKVFVGSNEDCAAAEVQRHRSERGGAATNRNLGGDGIGRLRCRRDGPGRMRMMQLQRAEEGCRGLCQLFADFSRMREAAGS